MENRQKWINLTYVAAAMLVAYLLFAGATKLSIILDFEGRVRSLDKIILASSALAGVLIFLGMNRSESANTFMGEVVSEVGKVTWPTQEETTKSTIAVLVAVVIAGFALWLIDSLGVYVLSLLL